MTSEKRFVLLVWAACAVRLMVRVQRYVVDLPYADDFAFISHIAGDEPMSLAWLWEPHNEHRMVLPKLAIVELTRLAGIDFRIVPCVGVVMFAVSALAATCAVARLRGRFVFSDALVPVIVCSWAQADALVWTSPFNLVASTAFLLTWWWAATQALVVGGVVFDAIAVIFAMCLALTGGSGVAALVGVVPALAWMALRHVRARRWPSVTVLALGITALCAYLVMCVLAYERPVGHPALASLGFNVRYGGRLLASSLSLVEAIGDMLAVALAALCSVAVVGALRAPLRRTASVAAMALLVGSLGVAGAVVVGRAGFGTLAIASRYVTLTIPFAVAILALLTQNARPFRTYALFFIASVVGLSFLANEAIGNGCGSWMRSRLSKAREALEAGESPTDVVAHFELYPDTAWGASQLELLQHAHGSVFSSIQPAASP